MAPLSTPVDLNAKYYVLYSWDWGTSKFSASAAICREGDDEPAFGPTPMRFRDRYWEIPMIAAWDDAGVFRTGIDLLNREFKDPSLADKIIDHFKVTFYDHPDTASRRQWVKDVISKCGDKSDVELLTESFQAMHNECMSAITKHSFDLGGAKAFFTGEQIVAMPYEIRISVPQMWTPNVRRNYQLAAKKAGLPKVVLVSEPQCVLALYIHIFEVKAGKAPNRLRKGCRILVADLGAGTADFVLYEILTEPDIESLLAALTQSSGDICGGIRIDKLIFNSLPFSDEATQIHEGQELEEAAWKKVAREYGWARDPFRRRIMQQISDFKPTFEDTREQWIVLPPKPGVGKLFTLPIRRHVYTQAFDVVIARITAKIDEMLGAASGVDKILVTGGTGKSAYVMKQLRKRYGPRGIEIDRPGEDVHWAEGHEVSPGALHRYKNITTQHLPSRYGYAALRRESFDEEIHTDAVGEDGEADPDFVQIDEVEYCDVVEDRLFTVIKKGDRLVPGQISESNSWDMHFQIELRKPEISATFVCLTEDKSDGARGKEIDGAYTAGVQPWAEVTLPVVIRKLRKQRYPWTYVKNPDGRKEQVFLAKAKVRMQCLGDQDIKVGVELYPRERKSPDDRPPQRGAARRVTRSQVAPPEPYELWEDLWDAKFSEFVDEKDEGEHMEVD